MQHLNTAVISNEQLWHRRFGRVEKEKLKQLPHGNVVNFLHMIQPMTLSFVKVKLVESKIIHHLNKVADKFQIYYNSCIQTFVENLVRKVLWVEHSIDHKSRYLWVY